MVSHRRSNGGRCDRGEALSIGLDDKRLAPYHTLLLPMLDERPQCCTGLKEKESVWFTFHAIFHVVQMNSKSDEIFESQKSKKIGSKGKPARQGKDKDKTHNTRDIVQSVDCCHFSIGILLLITSAQKILALVQFFQPPYHL